MGTNFPVLRKKGKEGRRCKKGRYFNDIITYNWEPMRREWDMLRQCRHLDGVVATVFPNNSKNIFFGN